MSEKGKELELSIVMPCLNEAETVGTCVRKALEFLKRNNVNGEVIVADNGSTDGSPEIASEAGARVVNIPERGYGNTIRGGIEAAKGMYVIVGDSDDSSDFLHLEQFLEKLREGFDLVMGNRFKGGDCPGCDAFPSQMAGQSGPNRDRKDFFGSPCGDFHCGLRGFRKEAARRMMLQTPGMEFASEMVVKATLLGMRITEVPTTLSRAGRNRPSHLRSWRDGWRHLRFLLLLSPKWLFGVPAGLSPPWEDSSGPSYCFPRGTCSIEDSKP